MKKFFMLSLAFVLFLLIAGITPAMGASRCESCREILAENPGAADGEYTIYPDYKTFTVYCHDMASGNPKEYLTLINTGDDDNYATYMAGEDQGKDVVTHYEKIRIDPHTLIVDTGDQTFAASTGSLIHGEAVVTWMPYGSAMSCVNLCDTSGSGNIDLTGTPFEVNDEFLIGGWNAAGTVSDEQGPVFSYPCGIGSATDMVTSPIVSLEAGGYCGYAVVAGNNEPNAGGGPLQLKYTGSIRSIPTLNEWGMILLVLGIVFLAARNLKDWGQVYP